MDTENSTEITTNPNCPQDSNCNPNDKNEENCKCKNDEKKDG